MAKDLLEILLQEEDEKPVILEVVIEGEKSHLKKDGVVKYDDGKVYCIMSKYDVVNKEEDTQVLVYYLDTENKNISFVDDLEVAKKVYCDFLYKKQQSFEYVPPKKD